MTVQDVLIDFWTNGLVMYLGYFMGPVFVVAAGSRVLMNLFPVRPRS